VVREMSEAYRDGRMDDLLAVLDSAWCGRDHATRAEPVFGHRGVQQLNATATACTARTE